MNCRRCGREVSEETILCPYCGERIARARRRSRGTDEPVPAARRARRGSEAQEPSSEAASEWGIPVSLIHSMPEGKTGVRYVQRAREAPPRKIDAKPVNAQPEIYRNTHRKLKNALLIALLFSVAVFSATAYVLVGTENGQRLMAQWGWSIANTDAYVTMGKDLLAQGYYTRAEEMLNVALERDPVNVDALIYMAQTQEALGNSDEAIRIYESLVSSIAPEHPGAYRNLIRMYQERNLNAEALAIIQTASDKTGRQEFGVMLREFTSQAPTFSKLAGRYNEEIDVIITIPANETVYYTIDGTDPSETGQVYERGLVIHIPEGKMTLKAIGFTDTGVPSEQVEANYTVIIPTPAAPKANYASGKYKKAPKVSLRPGDEDKKKNAEIVAIYYTLDGRQATTASTLYTGPIQLPTGDSELRAIAVAKNGKISYEMRVTYSVEGNLKRKFSTDDTFKNLALFRTNYTSFVKSHGTPDSYEPLPAEEGYDPQLESYEATYSWGTARFVIRAGDTSPVLYALDTRSEKMTAPRSTRVGMKGSEVIAKYLDLGHPPLDEAGNRLLYNYNSGGYMFGSYRREADGQYAIHYYAPVDERHTIFIELSYYLDNAGKVRRIVWQRYLAEVEVTGT